MEWLGPDAKCSRPLYFGAMSHTKVKTNYSQSKKIDLQTPLMSFDRHPGLEFDRPQS